MAKLIDLLGGNLRSNPRTRFPGNWWKKTRENRTWRAIMSDKERVNRREKTGAKTRKMAVG